MHLSGELIVENANTIMELVETGRHTSTESIAQRLTVT